MLGQVLELRIEKGVYRGLGLARHEGRVVFVSRGLPGERVRAAVVSEERGYLRTRVLEVLEPAAGRRAAPCAHASLCGGCSYQELGLAEQLRLKHAILQETLRRAHVEVPERIEVLESPEQGWRLRTVLHGNAEGQLGLHEEASHRVVPLARCWQLSESLNRSALAVASVLRERPQLLCGEREVELIESSDGSARVAALECPAESLLSSGVASRLQEGGELSGLGVLVRSGTRRSFLPLWGDARAEAQLPGLRLGWSPASFFQSNRFLLEPLVAAVVSRIAGSGPLIDLFAGVGLFSLALAAAGLSVDAVESHPGALLDARENLRLAGSPDVRLHGREALAWLRQEPRRRHERIVLDPPRTGAGRAVVEAIVSRQPACVVYVSCDPTTLARDLGFFAARGYRSDAWLALDLFPDTFHLETVVRLRPR